MWKIISCCVWFVLHQDSPCDVAVSSPSIRTHQAVDRQERHRNSQEGNGGAVREAVGDVRQEASALPQGVVLHARRPHRRAPPRLGRWLRQRPGRHQHGGALRERGGDGRERGPAPERHPAPAGAVRPHPGAPLGGRAGGPGRRRGLPGPGRGGHLHPLVRHPALLRRGEPRPEEARRRARRVGVQLRDPPVRGRAAGAALRGAAAVPGPAGAAGHGGEVPDAAVPVRARRRGRRGRAGRHGHGGGDDAGGPGRVRDDRVGGDHGEGEGRRRGDGGGGQGRDEAGGGGVGGRAHRAQEARVQGVHARREAQVLSSNGWIGDHCILFTFAHDRE